MRTEVFKTRKEYEEWERKAGNCIFCITDYTEDDSEGEFICDMIEDDFYELSDEKVGLINPEGFYYLLKPLTDKQKELLKENHGIRIIIIEEDFALSDEQNEAIRCFKNAWENLKKNDVAIIMSLACDSPFAVSTKNTNKVFSIWSGDTEIGSIDIKDAMSDMGVEFDAILGEDDDLICELK